MANQQMILQPSDDEEKHILSNYLNSDDSNKDEESAKGNRSSLPLASFNYINSIVGSGIIGMAYALNQAGVLLGLALIVAMGFVTDYSLLILIRAGRLSGASTYQGVMNAAFGRSGYFLLTLLQFIYPFIAMISYNVVVGDTITKVVVYYGGLEPDSVLGRRELVITFTTLFLSIPLALHDGMAKFAKISLISLVVTSFVLVTVIIRLFTLGPMIPRSQDAWTLAKPGVTEAVAVASFAYMCHHSTFLLYGSLRHPNEERWTRLTHVSVFVSAAFEVVFALFGYATFTGFVQGDLLENYCRADHMMNVARLLFCLTILMTAPIECFVARDIITNTFSVDQNKKLDGSRSRDGITRMEWITTILLTLAASVISLSTDCLSLVLELNGVLAAIPLAYVLPAICYIKLEPRSWNSLHKLPALLMAVFGVAIAIAGMAMVVVNWDINSSCSHGVEMPYCTENAIRINATCP